MKFVEKTIEFGPAFSRLNERQRKYVLAAVADPFASGAAWARAAGYSAGPHRKSSVSRVQAHRLMRHQPYVEEAMLEVARSLINREGPILAVAGMMEIARNKRHPKQLRALETLANRVGLHELSEHRVRVEHSEESAAAKAERIRMVADLLGVDVSQLLGANNVKDVSPNVVRPKDVTGGPGGSARVSRETKDEPNVKDVSPKLIEAKAVEDGGKGEKSEV